MQWIKTFYTDISSCVLNNGFTNDLFNLRRGVRKGHPLSPLLFILALEMLICQIRKDQSIKHIIVKDEEIKLTLFDRRRHHLFSEGCKIIPPAMCNMGNCFQLPYTI